MNSNKTLIKEVEESENRVEIFTNKESYRQGEEIYIKISFFSKADLEKSEIKVSGIKARYGNYISLSKVVDIKKGENIIEFSSRAPYCSSCTGVNPGLHEIEAQIFYNNTLIASASKNITIEA